MDGSRMLQVILFVGFLFAEPQALLSQNKQKGCEFPTLGYFEILGTKPSMLKDFYEITIGYLGVDKAEENGKPGTISLRGQLSLVVENSKPSNPKTEFEVNSTSLVRNDSVKVGFETAELTIDGKCKQSIKIVTDNMGTKQYVVTARFLRDYKKEDGRLYKLVGLVTIIEEGKPIQTFRVKFARSRE